MKSIEQYWGEDIEITTEPQKDGSWVASGVRVSQPGATFSGQGTTEEEAAREARTKIAEEIDRSRSNRGKP
jgi:hypothetical protein